MGTRGQILADELLANCKRYIRFRETGNPDPVEASREGSAMDTLGQLRTKVEALDIALGFTVGAIADAIYTEDGLDGEAGERVLRIIAEAKRYGTFDKRNVERAEMLDILDLAEDSAPSESP